MQPTFKGRLKRACNQISYLETPAQKVCLSEGVIYADPSLLRFYQNDDTPPWGNKNVKKKEKMAMNELLEVGLKIRSPTLCSKKVPYKRKSKTPEHEAPTFAITTRSGVSNQDPPFLAPSQSTYANHTEGVT
nr:hypothetical protein [Tanacetum cinerariifolium]